jgi:esterase/lipase
MMMVEDIKKDFNNSLKEIQENAAKQVENVKEEAQKSLKELQENTTKQVIELNKTIQDLKREVDTIKKTQSGQVWWCMPLIPALGRQRQVDL